MVVRGEGDRDTGGGETGGKGKDTGHREEVESAQVLERAVLKTVDLFRVEGL